MMHAKTEKKLKKNNTKSTIIWNESLCGLVEST